MPFLVLIFDIVQLVEGAMCGLWVRRGLFERCDGK